MKNIEKEILLELSKNPQIPFSRISKKLNISQNTVKKIYEKLKNEKVILHSSITIDLLKVGFQGTATFTIITEQKEETIEALKKISNIIFIAETCGDYNIMAIAIIKNYENMINIAYELRKTPTIKQIDIALAQEAVLPPNGQFTQWF